MKKIVGFCLFMGLVCLAHSQSIKVLDNETNAPLEAVNIYSKNPLQSTVTNAKGEAKIDSFKAFETLYISFIGYEELAIPKSELTEQSFTFKLEPSDFSLEEVVISANRWRQEKKEIANKITTISAKELSLQNPQTAADLLTVSGEVFVQKSQLGGGSPMIRGFSTNRLLYSVDGVRMNNAIFRSGNLQNVISLDPLAIESTEILFGPGSVIYGSDAIGAVMSFNTLKPKLALDSGLLVTGKAITRYSSANNEQTAHIDFNLGWKKWASVTSITASDYSDLKMGKNGPDDYLRPTYVQRINNVDTVIKNDDPRKQRPTGYSQKNFMQKIRFAPNKDWDFEYSFHHSETSSYARYDRLLRESNGVPRSAVWNYGPQLWQMHQLSITHTKPTQFYDGISLRMAHQTFEESRIDRDFGKTDLMTRTEEVKALSVNLDFNKILGESKLFYGLEFVHNDVLSTGMEENILTGETMTASARYPNAEWASYAAYVSFEKKFNALWLLNTGVRYNQFTIDANFSNNTDFYPLPFESATLDKGSLTGSIGVVFTPTESWVISSNISTAFRAPNVDDVGKIFDSEPGTVVVPNPDLKPEYAYNAEINATKILSKHAKLNFGGYYTYLDNALVRGTFNLNGQDSITYDGELSAVEAIQNGAYATVYGGHIGIQVSLASGLTLGTQYNIQNGKEKLDDGSTQALRHAAPRFGSTKLTYSKKKLMMQLYFVYNAAFQFGDLPNSEAAKDNLYAKDDNGNPYSPKWYTVNAKAQYQINRTFVVNAGLENILNVRYQPYSSGIAAPGRNLILSLKANF
jgi:hemoglobin/transferrin/lactoferrin receptor protein